MTRFINERDAPELIELFHTAKTALAAEPKVTLRNRRHLRMVWASVEFSLTHPDLPCGRIYRDLDVLLRFGPLYRED
jgi:hypothetical protein